MESEQKSDEILPEIPQVYSHEFGDVDLGMAHNMALMINLYVQHDGIWNRVLKDPRSVTKDSLLRYLKIPAFRQKINEVLPLLVQVAKGIVVEGMQLAPRWSDRLNAAFRFLEAHEGDVWDRGIRKQIVANKGSIANTLFKEAVSSKEFWGQMSKDPFAPEAVRKAALEYLENNGPNPLTLPEVIKEIPSPINDGKQNEVEVLPTKINEGG